MCIYIYIYMLSPAGGRGDGEAAAISWEVLKGSATKGRFRKCGLVFAFKLRPENTQGEGVQQGAGIQKSCFQIDPLPWTLNFLSVSLRLLIILILVIVIIIIIIIIVIINDTI